MVWLSARTRFWTALALSALGLAGFTLGLLWDWLAGRGLETGAIGPLQLSTVIGGLVTCGLGIGIFLIPLRRAGTGVEGEEE
ncbi:MAG: hypothetical protein QXH42_02195 [Thermoplasmata archaeon]